MGNNRPVPTRYNPLTTIRHSSPSLIQAGRVGDRVGGQAQGSPRFFNDTLSLPETLLTVSSLGLDRVVRS